MRCRIIFIQYCVAWPCSVWIVLCLFGVVGLWKYSKISTLWGKMGQIFALVAVRDYGNTTNGKMKNRKCG